MIVICTKCQAKFRVADEKIGARGAKVRCSKCQTVFLVHPELGTMPVSDGDARTPAERTGGVALEKPGAGVAPAAPARARPRPVPPPASAAAARSAVPAQRDPFGGADPFAAPPPTAADPFAAPPPAAADPFAAPAPATPGQDPFAAADPFAAPPADPPAAFGDPFAAPAPTGSSLPVTDLSDLLGSGARSGADPFAAPAPDGGLALEPPPAPDPFGALGMEPPAPFAAPAPPPDLAEAGGAPPDDGGLALEDRLTPPPTRVAAPSLAAAEPPLEIAGGDAPHAFADPPDPFAGFAAAPPPPASVEPFDPGAFDYDGALDVPTPPPAAAAPPPPAAAPPPPAPSAADATPPLSPSPAVPERIPGARTSRLRAVAVNAVALAALLVVALALWAVWRTDGPFEAGALRPSAILAALGRGGGAEGPWSALEIRSGIYDRERGPPLLFVRGRIASRATTPVPAVRVAVQVVRGGEVMARGEGIAGALPTAEELHGAADEAALAAVLAAARARAPAEIRPGDSVPFLVAIGSVQADLEGASLRVEVGPAPAPAAAPVPAGGGAP